MRLTVVTLLVLGFMSSQAFACGDKKKMAQEEGVKSSTAQVAAVTDMDTKKKKKMSSKKN